MEDIFGTLEKLEEKLRTVLTLTLKLKLKLGDYTFDSKLGAEVLSDRIDELLCDIDVYMDSAVLDIGDEIDMNQADIESEKELEEIAKGFR